MSAVIFSVVRSQGLRRSFAAPAALLGPLPNRCASVPLRHKKTFHSSGAARLAVGDKLPDVEVHGKNPADAVNVRDLFEKHDRAILFHVPGAFTPGCSKSHLPGYLERAEEFSKKGITMIACLSVNDAFVMQGWAKTQGVDASSDKLTITMLADPSAAYVKQAGLGFDATRALGGLRSKRAALVVEKGVVKHLEVEPDNTGLSVSLAENVMAKL